LKLHKIKRPGGIFSYDVRLLVEDEFGTWLHAPLGSPWKAPADQGTLPFDVLLLLSPERCWVAWWVDDPADRRLEIDVCLAPNREGDVWSFVDLELDPIRHQDGAVEIEDGDEFVMACDNGWISEQESITAETTAEALAMRLRQRDEPFGNEGWRRLDALKGFDTVRTHRTEDDTAIRQKHHRDPIIESLKERAWQEVREVDEALAEGRIGEDEWHDAMANLVKPAYLSADNPYGQAGHSGDAITWEASRGFIADALDRSGTFLDVGCASGILMESVQRWGAIRNLSVEPYGLDIVPEFVELARRRLPLWAHRIHLGNIRTWQPPSGRFDFVMIRPEYAPIFRRAELVRHVTNHVLAPGGRLIVFVGVEESACRKVESTMTTAEITVTGRVEVLHPRDSRVVRRLFWIDT